MRYLILLLVLVGCKSPQFTAKTKADLAKLCTYEFPYTGKILEQKIDTLIIRDVTIVRDSIDCSDKHGIEYIYLEVPNDTIIITETNEVESPAQSYYIADLEFKNEKLEQDKETSDKRYKRLWGWIIGILGLGGLLIYIIKR